MRKKLLFLLLLAPVPSFAQEGTYCNPVSDSLFAADPFVLCEDGVYYLYATSAGDGFTYWTSENLADWKKQGYAFRKNEHSWGRRSFWAPEVVKYRDRFYMIYSASGPAMFGDGLRLCLAVADRPEGPFRDLHAPLFDLGFSCIDGHIFIDEDGIPYLFFEKVGAVGEHWKKKGYLWGMIMGAELFADLSGILQEPKLCLYVSQEWEGPESMKARSVEGMTVLKQDGRYYMTYSANHYADPKYGIGYAVSEHPLGMWTKYEGNPILEQNLEIGVSGPGHNCIVQSPDQGEYFIIYHSHADTEAPSGKRVLNIDRMTFGSDGRLSVLGPTRTPQPLPSGAVSPIRTD